MPMWRCEMKKVLGIYNNPGLRLVDDGFPVQPLFSYDMLGHRISPFLVLDLFRLLWRTTMSTLIKGTIPIFLGLSIVPAQAQWLGPTWETYIILTQLDLDMIHAAVTQQIHGKAVGTTASWSNPASYNWGSIRLVKKLALRDQQCEELEYTMRTARPEIYSEHYHFTSCLQPDGTWKIA
jgi:hypothetical protein